MINLTSFDDARLEETPYRHVLLQDIIDLPTATLLTAQLPNTNEVASSRSWGSDKTYKVKNNVIYNLKTGFEATSMPWQKLIECLASREYIRSVENLLKIDLSNTSQEMTFKRYTYGDYISPHTDRNFSLVTHLFFFNKEWDQSWGGLLQLLDQNLNIVKEIFPLYNHSIIFERSDASWHSVSKCINQDQVRYSLQVVFCKNDEKENLPGREETNNYEY